MLHAYTTCRAPTVYPLCPCQALLLPFSETQKGVNTGFCPLSPLQRVKGGEGVVSLYRVTTVTTWTNTHNEQHTDGKWRKRERKIKRGRMDTGPSAESGDDDVPVCSLRRRGWSWQEAGWRALPVGSGMEYQSDKPPRHQALLPGS